MAVQCLRSFFIIRGKPILLFYVIIISYIIIVHLFDNLRKDRRHERPKNISNQCKSLARGLEVRVLHNIKQSSVVLLQHPYIPLLISVAYKGCLTLACLILGEALFGRLQDVYP
jgi:hypothetical protein